MEYFDEDTTGLALRVTETGSKSWTFNYTTLGDKRSRSSCPEELPLVNLRVVKQIAGLYLANDHQYLHVIVRRGGRNPGQESYLCNHFMSIPRGTPKRRHSRTATDPSRKL
jgi:hypothetical protein